MDFSLRDRAQVEQLVRYIVEEPPEDADSKRTFKYVNVVQNQLVCNPTLILMIDPVPVEYLYFL